MSILNAFHVYLPAVVEVPVGVHLELLQLLHLIQHLMHIEFGHEELQTAVSVSLTAKQREAQCIYIMSLYFCTVFNAMYRNLQDKFLVNAKLLSNKTFLILKTLILLNWVAWLPTDNCPVHSPTWVNWTITEHWWGQTSPSCHAWRSAMVTDENLKGP